MIKINAAVQQQMFVTKINKIYIEIKFFFLICSVKGKI